MHYEYHSGITRCSISNYVAFKTQVYYLIKHGLLQLKKLGSLLNVGNNSMLGHGKGEDKSMNV